MAIKTYQPRLKTQYLAEIRSQLKDEFGLTNIHQVPRLEKIVVSVGLGRGKDDKRLFETATNTLVKITGQQPLVTTARISVASFKLRAGQKIGLKVTLRGNRMYEFLDRLISLVMPRLRDFRGASRQSFDMDGNYSLGLRDQAVFPELTFEETNPTHGLQVTIVIENRSSKQSQALMEQFGFRFTKLEGGVRHG